MLPEVQSPFVLPPLDQVPDDEQDKPLFEGHLQDEIRPLGLPRIIFGAGAFSNQYNKDTHLASAAPLRTVRLALRYGVRAFDTSPYYGPSEIILGDSLRALSGEFPRSSYQLMTKCGRYGPSTFDYTPSTIRESVERSVKRLHTDYLDTVFLHDVEFVCTQVAPRATGDNSTALDTEALEFGLAQGHEAKIHGDGDQKILDAFAELRKMKEEGLIRNIGITGYPLPTLLRLALCILHNPPYEPVDVILSYSHLNLQNSTFLAFASHLNKRAKVKQLLAASPLSMGLLTPSPPQWHPAPPPLLSSAIAAGKLWDQGLPDLALGYAIRFAEGVPLVAGFSSPEEVHHCLKVSKEVFEGDDRGERVETEQLALATFRDAGYLDWSWSSP
ncbi:Aldo-keto reductase [Pleurotus pulmonarius]